MQGNLISRERNVCLSVRLSVKRVICDSLILNDLERRNAVCVISPNSVAFGADCVKVIKTSAAEM